MSEMLTSPPSPRSSSNLHTTKQFRAHQPQINSCLQTHFKTALISAKIYGPLRLQSLHNTNNNLNQNSCSQLSRTCLKKASLQIISHTSRQSRPSLHLISSSLFTTTVLSSKVMSELSKIKYLICKANCALLNLRCPS
jgi:hypothetical protein